MKTDFLYNLEAGPRAPRLAVAASLSGLGLVTFYPVEVDDAADDYWDVMFDFDAALPDQELADFTFSLRTLRDSMEAYELSNLDLRFAPLEIGRRLIAHIEGIRLQGQRVLQLPWITKPHPGANEPATDWDSWWASLGSVRNSSS